MEALEIIEEGNKIILKKDYIKRKIIDDEVKKIMQGIINKNYFIKGYTYKSGKLKVQYKREMNDSTIYSQSDAKERAMVNKDIRSSFLKKGICAKYINGCFFLDTVKKEKNNDVTSEFV